MNFTLIIDDLHDVTRELIARRRDISVTDPLDWPIKRAEMLVAGAVRDLEEADRILRKSGLV